MLESNVFAEQTIQFARLTALTGSHGTGKSLLLKMIEAAFGTYRGVGDVGLLSLRAWLNGGRYAPDTLVPGVLEAKLRMTVLVGGSSVVREVDLTTDWRERGEMWAEALGQSTSMEYTGPVDMLEIMSFSIEDVEHFRSRPLAEYRAHRYNREQRAAALNILGRNYREVSIYGIPDSDHWADPHYQAVLDGSDAVISTPTMSLGELWVHWLIGWKMGYHQQAAHGWMIDEPETFLRAHGHRPLLDELVRLAVNSGSQLIVATHSPDILRHIPEGNIRFCARRDDKLVVGPFPRAAHTSDLRGDAVLDRRHVVVFVEDSFAERMLGLLLRKFDSSLCNHVDILAASGSGNVVKLLTGAPTTSPNSYVGVLDGDCRAPNQSTIPQALADRVLFLPGCMGPDEELIEVAASATDTLARSLGVDSWDVTSALDRCRFDGHQRRLNRLATGLDRNEDVLIDKLMDTWLEQHSIAAEAQQLVDGIRRHVA
ncbi:Predicted ATPase [Mycobacterium senegalense]|uniref:Predicted ATPase n=1 Tax=Mycolicibacterium senegalense TaxID=1796 RepID=A0A378SV31_9MYCO|nr:Predicted ATPase [Mycolicibacterium senegalense]